MDSKKCPTCQLIKPISDFYPEKNKPKGGSRCKICFHKYCVERWIKLKKRAIEYKGSSCVDCNISYPNAPYVIFDFHHLNPIEKDMDWNELRKKSWERITKELDKCALLCSNCHRIRHHKKEN